MTSFIEIAAYGLHELKTQGHTRMPVHLAHMYVVAQDFMAGAMTLGSCNGNGSVHVMGILGKT